MVLAQLERIAIQQHTQRAADRRALEGTISSSHAPYGYRYQYFLIANPTVLVTDYKLRPKNEKVGGEHTHTRDANETRQMESLIHFTADTPPFTMVVHLRGLGDAMNLRNGEEWLGYKLKRAVESYLERKNRG
jgi:hypothetical protein